MSKTREFIKAGKTLCSFIWFCQITEFRMFILRRMCAHSSVIPASCLFMRAFMSPAQQRVATSPQSPWGTLKVDCSLAPPHGLKLTLQWTNPRVRRWVSHYIISKFCKIKTDLTIKMYPFPPLCMGSGASNAGMTIENEAWPAGDGKDTFKLRSK